MFAVIKTGGKQYRVEKDDIIEVEKIVGQPGDAIKFDSVLMVGDKESVETGEAASKSNVEGKIVYQKKGPKIVIQKFHRRKDSKKRTGHRQLLTRVAITSIKKG
ncbi:MAG: 50S ribosomal protein L21 [Nitrospinota bacterium]